LLRFADERCGDEQKCQHRGDSGNHRTHGHPLVNGPLRCKVSRSAIRASFSWFTPLVCQIMIERPRQSANRLAAGARPPSPRYACRWMTSWLCTTRDNAA
jgi:hypothetical protein